VSGLGSPDPLLRRGPYFLAAFAAAAAHHLVPGVLGVGQDLIHQGQRPPGGGAGRRVGVRVGCQPRPDGGLAQVLTNSPAVYLADDRPVYRVFDEAGFGAAVGGLDGVGVRVLFPEVADRRPAGAPSAPAPSGGLAWRGRSRNRAPAGGSIFHLPGGGARSRPDPPRGQHKARDQPCDHGGPGRLPRRRRGVPLARGLRAAAAAWHKRLLRHHRRPGRKGHSPAMPVMSASDDLRVPGRHGQRGLPALRARVRCSHTSISRRSISMPRSSLSRRWSPFSAIQR
jgi:hypothetical protein